MRDFTHSFPDRKQVASGVFAPDNPPKNLCFNLLRLPKHPINKIFNFRAELWIRRSFQGEPSDSSGELLIGNPVSGEEMPGDKDEHLPQKKSRTAKTSIRNKTPSTQMKF